MEIKELIEEELVQTKIANMPHAYEAGLISKERLQLMSDKLNSNFADELFTEIRIK